jgi:hypothetical protein
MPLPPLTKEDLIELWRRINPPNYTVPIEDEQNGQGFDVPSAQAEIFAFADQEVNEAFQSHYLKPSADQTGDPASAGVKATTEVQITRVTSTVGDLPLDAGTKLAVEQLGSLGQTIELVNFELAEALTLPEGDRGPFTAQVQAQVEGYAGNVAAGSIVGFLELGRAAVSPVTVQNTTQLQRFSPPPGTVTDRFTLGMIGRFVTLVGLPSGVQAPRKVTAMNVVSQIATIEPPLPAGDVGATGITVQVAELGDLGLEVEQPEDATGGRLAMLDAIGRDRRSGRVVGESDADYRARLCELADTVSPAAIDRVVADILTPCGINFEVHETRAVEELKGFVWDLDPYDFGQLLPIPRNPAGDLIGEGAVWLDQATAWSFFFIRVGLGNQGEFGAPYDAAPPGLTPPNAWSQFFWDGSPVVYLSCLAQVWEAVNGARAAGVAFEIVQDPALT